MLFALALAATLAQTSDTTVPVQRGQRLELGVHSGDVTVRAWQRSAVRVQFESEDDDDRIRVDLSGSSVNVSTGSRYGAPVEGNLSLTVPAWMPLSINGVEVSANVDGVVAPITIETVNGEIEVRGGEGTISLHSVDGSVKLTGARGRIEIGSVNEDVSVLDSQGDIKAETVNGGVELLRVQGTNVEATTVNGDITFSGPVRPNGRYKFSTHNGDLTVGIPEDASARITVSTFQGDFESDFPVMLQNRKGKQFSFTLGSGSAWMELESFQGTIHLTRPSTVDQRHHGR